MKMHKRFQDLLPETDQECDKLLEESLRKEGRCLVNLVAWNGFLVDGYRRWNLIQKFGWKEGVHYEVDHLDPELTEDEVEAEIIKIQLRRRNVHTGHRDSLLYQLYQVYGQLQSVTLPSPGTSGQGGQSVPENRLGKQRNIAKEVASQAGVHEQTVRRAVEKGKQAEQLPPMIRKQHENGTCTLNKGQIERVLQCPELGQLERSVRTGQSPDVSQAFQKITGKPLTKPQKTPVQQAVEEEEGAEEEDLTPDERMEQSNRDIESACRFVTNIFRDRVTVLADENGWIRDKGRLGTAEQSLKSALTTIRSCKGVKICTKCEGEGCKLCRDTGWWDKNTAMQMS